VNKVSIVPKIFIVAHDIFWSVAW